MYLFEFDTNLGGFNDAFLIFNFEIWKRNNSKNNIILLVELFFYFK